MEHRAWEDNIKLVLKEIVCDGGYWNDPTKDLLKHL
jgi:hypothetical protein